MIERENSEAPVVFSSTLFMDMEIPPFLVSAMIAYTLSASVIPVLAAYRGMQGNTGPCLVP
jgi:hypothetical protein